MNEKKKLTDQVWTDGTGDEFWAIAVRASQPDRFAVLVGASVPGVYLTAAQCREVAAHLTALADAHEEAARQSGPVFPTEPGAVIIPADGHEYIEVSLNGQTWRTREAILNYGDLWCGVWRSGDDTSMSVCQDDITPGTWQVEGE